MSRTAETSAYDVLPSDLVRLHTSTHTKLFDLLNFIPSDLFACRGIAGSRRFELGLGERFDEVSLKRLEREMVACLDVRRHGEVERGSKIRYGVQYVSSTASTLRVVPFQCQPILVCILLDHVLNVNSSCHNRLLAKRPPTIASVIVRRILILHPAQRTSVCCETRVRLIGRHSNGGGGSVLVCTL